MGAMKGPAAAAFTKMSYHKFAATVNEKGEPNVVPLLSARMIDPDTIAFAKFMVWKTRRNFEANGKITFACPGPGGKSYAAKGEFTEWRTEGPILEEFEKEPLYRYNAYMGANLIGIVKVKEVLEFPGEGMIKPLISALAVKPPAPRENGGPMGARVMEKWGRRLAIKFIGMIDKKGDPIALPLQRLTVLNSSTMAFPMRRDIRPLADLKKGDRVAASVLVLDPSGYQVKGRFLGAERLAGKEHGFISVDEVYTASPPVPGRRIYPLDDYLTRLEA